MNNTTEPRLPEFPLQQNKLNELGYFLLYMLPWTMFVGLPFVYSILYLLKYIFIAFCKKMSSYCEDYDKVELKNKKMPNYCEEYTKIELKERE